MWNDSPALGNAYDWLTFTLSSGASDYDVKANQATSFSNIPVATKFIIETTRDISVKINKTTFPAIYLSAGSSPMEWKNITTISNVYLSNASGSDATIRIILA